MSKYNSQLSRYGAISKVLPLMNPGAKVHFVGPSSAAWYGDFLNEFGPDAEGGNRVFPTITAAIADGNVVASRGDVILVLPGYTQTVTTPLTLSKAGVSIIGIGTGSLRPTITGNGAVDAVDITAANVTIENIAFAAPLTDAQTSAINVAAGGDFATIRRCSFIGSVATENIVDIITLVAGANGVTIEDNTFYNLTVAVNSGIHIEGALSDLTIRRNYMVLEVVAGGIIDTGAATNLRLEDNVIVVTGTSKSGIVLDSNPTGAALRNYVKGTNTTLASNVNYGNALALFEVRTAEDFAVQGAVIPAADTD